MQMSNLFRQPDWRGADELEAILPRLETVRFEPVYVMGEKLENRWAVVSNKSQKTYSLPTEKYEITQNWQVVAPFARAIIDSGVEDFSGSIREIDGKMYAMFKMNSPEYLPVVRGQEFATTFTLTNSYTCQLSMKGLMDVWKLVCTNGMMGMFPEVQFAQDHIMAFDEAVSVWGTFLDKVLGMPVKLNGMIEVAESKEIQTKDALKVLLGAGFGINQANKIYDLIDGTKQVMNGWELYNCGNAVFSHADNGQEKMDRQRDNIAKCNKLLTGDYSRYLDDGTVILKAIDDAKKEKQALKIVASP
jgi:hypothetical protein